MPLVPRDQGPGYFHVTTRGNNGDDVFLTSDDRRAFLLLLNRVVRRRDWALHVWCLMTNHFHLLVETPHEDLSAGMQHLNGVYAQWFNACYGHTGHVFGRRFWAKRIEGEGQLRTTAEYTAEGLDLVPDSVVVRTEERLDVLRVEPLGARGEADEVDEDDADQTPLLARVAVLIER